MRSTCPWTMCTRTPRTLEPCGWGTDRRRDFASISTPPKLRCAAGEHPSPVAQVGDKVPSRPARLDGREAGSSRRFSVQHNARILRQQATSSAPMARASTGELTERRWSDGQTITYGARVRAYGRRHRLTFGTNRQGWNRTRAEIALEGILQKVERGTWSPPERRGAATRSQDTAAGGRQPFGLFASESGGLRRRATAWTPTPWPALSGGSGTSSASSGAWSWWRSTSPASTPFATVLAERSRIIRDAALRGKPITERVTPKTGKPLQAAQVWSLQWLDQRNLDAAQPDPSTCRRLWLHRA